VNDPALGVAAETSDPASQMLSPVRSIPCDTAEPQQGLALCLSRGGYRALLFHLGVVWRLNEAGVLPESDRCPACRGLDHWLDELTSDLDCPIDWVQTTLRRFVDLDLAIILDGRYPSQALSAYPYH
jgi:hypothetical protein